MMQLLLVAGEGEGPRDFLRGPEINSQAGREYLPTGNLPRRARAGPLSAPTSALYCSVSDLRLSPSSIAITMMQSLPARMFCILQTPNEMIRRIELDVD